MARCYIAGCVTDGGRITEDGYRQKFARAGTAVRRLGHEPLNPTTLDHDHQRRWQDFMRVALHAMLNCDVLYVLPCWKRSKGATIEVQLALRLEKQIIYAGDNQIEHDEKVWGDYGTACGERYGSSRY